MDTHESFIMSVEDRIAHVQIKRPDRASAMNRRLWDEIKRTVDRVDEAAEVRAAVPSGRGRHFCAGCNPPG